MADCSCYHNDVNFIGERGVCWGTKEKEPCRCGGDETKCDFYPKRAAIVLSKDKAFKFKLDGETSQIQVIKDMKKYGLAVMSPKTNADRLRSMSDEELATFFGTLPCCPPGNADELCFPDNTCGADTKMMVKCWGTWLKAPVEEEGKAT